jgi:hypothetical protein
VPKCMFPECKTEPIKSSRSKAAVENGWFTFDFNFKSGNKYGNICSEHDKEDVRERIIEALDGLLDL